MFSLSIMAATPVAIADTLFGPFDKRDLNGFVHLNRRQDNCTSQCTIFETIIQCSDAACVCSTANNASARFAACTACIEQIDPAIASNITLATEVCSNCESQCGTTLDAQLQAVSCNSLECACSVFASVGETDVTTCANCLKPFSSTAASGLLDLVQECNSFTAPSSTAGSPALSTTNAASSSVSGLASASKSTAQPPSTVSSTGSSAPLSTNTHSAALRLEPEVYGALSWMIMTLGVFAFTVLLV